MTLRRRLVYAPKKYGREKLEGILKGTRKLPTSIPANPGYMSLKTVRKLEFASRKSLREFYGFHSGKEIKKIYDQILKSKMYMRPNGHIRLLDALERRLDIFCYKVGYFNSVFSARQGCKHGYISVNGRLMRKYRYTLQDNDFISLNFNSSNFTYQKVSDNIRKRIEIFTKYFENNRNMLEYYISRSKYIGGLKKTGVVNIKETETKKTKNSDEKESTDEKEKEMNPIEQKLLEMQKEGAENAANSGNIEHLLRSRNISRFVPRIPAHVPRSHFDFNYTTLSVIYRRSISNVNDMIDFGSTFGRHNDISRTLQYY